MKAIDFINEVKESGIVIEDFDAKYADFQRYQQMGIEMLKHFRDICEKNNIHYQLGFGTLLGAIRDGGVIPWDYDIDTLVPFEERHLLIKALKEDLDKVVYYFEGPETNKKCPRSLTRIGIVGYSTDEMHIDIFYYAGGPDDIEECKKMTQRLAEIQTIRFAKFVNPFTFSYGNWKKVVLLLLKKLKYLGVSGNKILREYDEICNRYKMTEAKYVFLTGRHAVNGLYLKSDMYDTISYDIDYGVFKVPVGYKKILGILYNGNNYLQYYPLESRLKEFLTNYRKLKEYSQKKYHKLPTVIE